MSTTPPSHLIRFGDFEFDVETGDLWNRGHRVRLQDQPRQVLIMLLEHPGQLVTREALRASLWPGDTFVDFDAGVNVVVNKIRHVLRDSASSPRFVETIPRRGYRFIAPVATVSSNTDVPEQPAIPSADGNLERPRSGGRGIALLTGWLVLGAAGIWGLVSLPIADGSRDRGHAAASSAAGDPVDRTAVDGSVAVAVFENQTGDPSLDVLGQRAAEGIIRLVAGVSRASVLPLPVRTAPGATPQASAVSSASTASLLVTGTYYLNGDVLEFRARILDARSGRLLYGTPSVSAPRSRPAEGLTLLEQTVAGAVAVHFDEFFGGLDALSNPPPLDVYREYRAGLETFWSDYPRALAHLTRAIEQKPDFLPPIMIRRIAYGNLGESKKAEDALTEMETRWDRLTAAERLWVELARSNWEGRRAQALRILEDLERLVPSSLFVNHNLVQYSVMANRLRAAVRAYDKRRLDDRTLRHSIGALRRDALLQALHLLGEYEREVQEARLAQAYVPGDRRAIEAEARALVALRRVSEVPRLIDRSLSMTPVAGPRHSPGEVMEGIVREMRVHGYRDESTRVAARAVEWYRSRAGDADTSDLDRAGFARVLYLAEQWDEADALFSALVKEDPRDVDSLTYLGCIAARTGDGPRARHITAKLARIRGHYGWIRLQAFARYGQARIAALLQQREHAVDLLREALAQGWQYSVVLHNEPDFEFLRQYEPYIELMRPLD